MWGFLSYLKQLVDCGWIVLQPPLCHLHRVLVRVPVFDGLGNETLGVLSGQVAFAMQHLQKERRN
jgi:hypothetical protein